MFSYRTSILKVHNWIDCLKPLPSILAFSTVRNFWMRRRAWSLYLALRTKLSIILRRLINKLSIFHVNAIPSFSEALVHLPNTGSVSSADITTQLMGNSKDSSATPKSSLSASKSSLGSLRTLFNMSSLVIRALLLRRYLSKSRKLSDEAPASKESLFASSFASWYAASRLLNFGNWFLVNQSYYDAMNKDGAVFSFQDSYGTLIYSLCDRGGIFCQGN